MADIKIKILRAGAIVPSRSHVGDAGWDLAIPDPLEIYSVFGADNRQMPFDIDNITIKEVADKLDMSWEVDPPSVVIPPGYRALVPLGFAVALPEESPEWGWELQFRPRSGSALKKGLTLANAVGTVDSGYRGECGVILLNTSDVTIKLAPGERIGQAVLGKYFVQRYSVVDTLPETNRGEGGFGSTGD